MSRKDLSVWRIFRIPAAVAVFSLAGLIGALLDDGLLDDAGAALLSLAVLAAIWGRWRSARRRHERRH